MAKPSKIDHCPNCDTALEGQNFCPNCGQKNAKPDLRIGHFITESLSNFFAFDSRFVHTLATLFSKPGKIAREYVEGRRMSYMHPARIYLLSAFVFLFVSSFEPLGEGRIQPVKVKKDDAKIGEALPAEQRAELKREWSNTNPEEGDNYDRMNAFNRMYPNSSWTEARDSMQLEDKWSARFFFDLSKKLTLMDGDDFGRFYMSKILWVLFLFVPVFSLWLKLLYIRRRVHYIAHLFYAYYTNSLALLLGSLGLALFPLLGPIPLLIFALVHLVYLWFAQRQFYGQSRWKRFFKYFAMHFGFIFCFLMVLFGSLVLSFIAY